MRLEITVSRPKMPNLGLKMATLGRNPDVEAGNPNFKTEIAEFGAENGNLETENDDFDWKSRV